VAIRSIEERKIGTGNAYFVPPPCGGFTIFIFVFHGLTPVAIDGIIEIEIGIAIGIEEIWGLDTRNWMSIVFR
jgi:hypothetical protein